MSKRLYARNQSIYDNTVYLLKGLGVKEFHSLNELYIFIENVKYPFLSRTRPNSESPTYTGSTNYGPIIDKLVENGILLKIADNQTEFTVNL
jgi:hypothetical protein